MTELINNTIPSGQSDEVYITLPLYNLQWSFSKRQIIKKYPQSLLATILEQDRDTKEIEITQPFITPTVMSILSILLEDCGDMTPEIIQELRSLLMNGQVDLVQPSRYFLIPELGLYDDVGFLELLETYAFNELINPRFMNKYDELINTITGLEYPAYQYLQYIWEHVPYERTYETDTYLYYWAISIEDDDLVESIISKRHIDPATSRLEYNTYIKLSEVLPNAQIRDITYDELSDTPSLDIASAYGNDELVVWFLEHTSLRDDNDHALLLARDWNHYSTILILLQYNQYPSQTLVNTLKDLPSTEPDEEDVGVIRDIYKAVLDNQDEGREAINQIIERWDNPELISLYNLTTE